MAQRRDPGARNTSPDETQGDRTGDQLLVQAAHARRTDGHYANHRRSDETYGRDGSKDGADRNNSARRNGLPPWRLVEGADNPVCGRRSDNAQGRFGPGRRTLRDRFVQQGRGHETADNTARAGRPTLEETQKALSHDAIGLDHAIGADHAAIPKPTVLRKSAKWLRR